MPSVAVTCGTDSLWVYTNMTRHPAVFGNKLKTYKKCDIISHEERPSCDTIEELNTN
jgi:hypothetical protein